MVDGVSIRERLDRACGERPVLDRFSTCL